MPPSQAVWEDWVLGHKKAGCLVGGDPKGPVGAPWCPLLAGLASNRPLREEQTPSHHASDTVFYQYPALQVSERNWIFPGRPAAWALLTAVFPPMTFHPLSALFLASGHCPVGLKTALLLGVLSPWPVAVKYWRSEAFRIEYGSTSLLCHGEGGLVRSFIRSS